MPSLTITAARADLLRAIAAGKVTEFWNDDEQPGDITLMEAPGQHAHVTGKVRVFKTVGLAETDPADAALNTRGIKLTADGEKALANFDAKAATGRGKLKVYTLGIDGFIRSEVNEALGLEPHIRQASVMAVVTTKTHAVQVYADHGFLNVSVRDSEFRVTRGKDVDALADAGLLSEPAVWVLPFLARPGSAVVRMDPGGVPRRVGRLDGPHHRPSFVPEEEA